MKFNLKTEAYFDHDLEDQDDQVAGIPRGWRKLHKAALTITSEHKPEYANEFFRDWFGATSLREQDACNDALDIVANLRRPRREHPRPGPMDARHSEVVQPRDGPMIGESPPGEVVASTGEKIPLQLLAKEGSQMFERGLNHSLRLHRPDTGVVIRSGRYRTNSGPDPTHQVLLNSTGDSASGEEKQMMTREEVRQSSSGNSPPVDSSVKRANPATVRPKKKSKRRRQRAGPGRKSWIESAYLFSIVDGEVVSKPVRIKIDTNADGISRMKLAVSTNDSREIVDRTRVPKIRRLNKERAKDSVRGQIVQLPMGIHGDRLNLTEVNP